MGHEGTPPSAAAQRHAGLKWGSDHDLCLILSTGCRGSLNKTAQMRLSARQKIISSVIKCISY